LRSITVDETADVVGSYPVWLLIVDMLVVERRNRSPASIGGADEPSDDIWEAGVDTCGGGVSEPASLSSTSRIDRDSLRVIDRVKESTNIRRMLGSSKAAVAVLSPDQFDCSAVSTAASGLSKKEEYTSPPCE
jgi:hypothetical protein